jgi:cytoskeletal protein CcmA (bactofilin family)
MMFKSGPQNEPKQPAFNPVLPDEHKAEVPRHVQHTFISADTTVTGDLESAGDLSIEGSVEGNITCRTLTLRGEPTITGDVHVEAVHVCGRFTGALRAKKVVVTKVARMTGDIYYETLELQEGAEFEGGIHCTGDSASKPATKDATASQEL